MIACTLAISPALREQLASLRAGEGRREGARPILPSNPVLSGGLASRANPIEQKLNWNLGLAQELEVGGQRRLRLDLAEGELSVQVQRIAATKGTIAADAWLAYFRSIAARERLKLTERLEAATEGVATTVRGMVAAGLTSEVDADVSDAAAIRAAQDRLKAEELVAVGQAQLRFLVGDDLDVNVVGDLEPLKSVAAVTAVGRERPELLAVRDAQAVLARRVDLLRRSRVPNPTLSLFAQSDGFDERVLGVVLSIPIPLPQPIGRTQAGEISEAVAFTERAKAEADRVGRELQAELMVAFAEYGASLKARVLYTRERTQRASARLESIALQIKAARLPVRDALVAQQALVEQLKAEIDAREALCLASVRLTRAAGLSLEGDSL